MKAVILAGGFGTRISEESVIKPKPMIGVGHKPRFLEQIFRPMKTVSANCHMIENQTKQSKNMSNLAFSANSKLRAVMNKLTPSASRHWNVLAAVTLALLLGVCSSAYSSPLIQITPDDPWTTDAGLVVSSSGWNVLKPVYSSVTGLPDYEVTNLKDSTGNPTGISLAADDTNRFNAYNLDGSLVASPGFPADVKRESFFGNDVAFNGFVRPTATWVFGGFNPNDDLTFTFFASRMVVDPPIDNREGKYEVVGATTESTTLNATNNESNTASVTVKADEFGNVVLNMTKGPNNTNSFGYFYLNAMTVTVGLTNDAPVAVADSYTTDEDTPLVIAAPGLLANDTDAENDPLTAIKVSDPANGTVTVNADGSFTYTPGANYSGPDSFTYKANDGTADSASAATVAITVVAKEEFTQWMDGYDLTDGPGVDSDGDSISNAVEYVIGGHPAGGQDSGLLPTVELASADLAENPGMKDYLVFTYHRTDIAHADPSTTISVEWGTSLTNIWTVADGTNGEVIQAVENGDFDLVNVYIPRSLAPDGKLFARLAVSIAAP